MYIIREEDTLLYLLKEANYGAGGSFAAADAMVAESVTLRPLEGNKQRIQQVRGFKGASRGSRSETYVSIEIVMALAGSGAVDQVPAHGLLYQGSSHNATITAMASVDYALIDANEDSLYGGFFALDTFHPLRGLRGGLRFQLGTDGIGRVVFNGFALYDDPTKTSPPTPDFSAFQLPQDINASTVTEMLFYGQSVGMSALEITGRDTAQYLNVANQEEVIQSSGGNGAGYSITFREGDVGVFNFFQAAKENTPGALAFQLGTDVTDAGNIFEFDAPVVEIDSVERVYQQNVAFLRCAGPIVPTAKNNDYTFTHR